MAVSKNCRYFLGANSKHGFVSLYGDFAEKHADCRLICIKGSPGSGKSTLMRRLAEEAKALGLRADTILCSGDPDSLDGVFIPEAGLIYFDATSPHVVEPAVPGASGRYLDLSAVCRDEEGLRAAEPELRGLFSRYRGEYERAYALLRAAAETEPPYRESDAVSAAIRRRARSILAHVPAGRGFREERRFLSAMSAEGRLRFYDSVAAAERLILANSEYGLAHKLIGALRALCIELGESIVLFPDPLDPDRAEGILLPDRSLAVLAEERTLPCPLPASRRIRLDTLLPSTADERATLRREGKLRQELLALAQEHLRRAKKAHDELEALYRPYMDFSAAEQLFAKERERLRRCAAAPDRAGS